MSEVFEEVHIDCTGREQKHQSGYELSPGVYRYIMYFTKCIMQYVLPLHHSQLCIRSAVIKSMALKSYMALVNRIGWFRFTCNMQISLYKIYA